MARRAGDVAPYQATRWWGMVGADVLGGPRPRGVPVGVPWCPRRRGAPGTSRPTRRHARTHCVHGASATAYLPPVEERAGVRVEIGSFPQKTGLDAMRL